MAAAPTGENELWLLLSDLIWHKISGKARQMWHERCPSCLAVSRIHSHSCSGGHRAPAVKNKTHSPPLPPHSSPCSLPPKPYLNFSSFQAQSLTLSSTFTPKLALLQDPPGHTNSAFPTLPGGISSRAGNCHARGSRALGQGYPPHPPLSPARLSGRIFGLPEDSCSFEDLWHLTLMWTASQTSCCPQKWHPKRKLQAGDLKSQGRFVPKYWFLSVFLFQGSVF